MNSTDKTQKQVNSSGNLDYDLILVTVEDTLVHTKSGSKIPRNIADFMPDYNLWYALKFCNSGGIWVIENQDHTRGLMTLAAWETKYSFISIWLSQMIDKKCRKLYSIKRNWIPDWGCEGEDIPDLIQKWSKWAKKILFIDKDTRENEDYIKSKGYLEYMTKSEFTQKYNKNPRIYEKK